MTLFFSYATRELNLGHLHRNSLPETHSSAAAVCTGHKKTIFVALIAIVYAVRLKSIGLGFEPFDLYSLSLCFVLEISILTEFNVVSVCVI